MDILRDVLDRASKVEQVTVEETERLLRDRLPTVLEALRLRSDRPAHRALREYEAKEIRAPNNLMQAKRELLDSLRDGGGAADLLDAVRTKIADQGYRDHGVLFELFQNADDAYEQLEGRPDECCFRVYHDDRGLRTVHWGRPINHLGSNAESGRDLGYDRDLLNMLVMSFSEKRPEHAVTGKFGLGFKCVHMLSDEVGVASRFVAVRIVGGLLPTRWQEGVSKAYDLRHDRSAATLIDVPYTAEMMEAGKRTVAAFQDAMRWLPAFARRIRRIELVGDTGRTITCGVEPLSERDGRVAVVTMQDGVRTERALRLDLGAGYSMLIRIEADGPCSFAPSLGRLWNLAPLAEDLRHSGWLLNGPFPVDPGRGRLAGPIGDRQRLFERLGKALGDQLMVLYDLIKDSWESFSRRLSLGDGATPVLFWSRLFSVMSRDLEHDDLPSRLHARDNRGLGSLGGYSVTPTRLPEPFDGAVRAAEVDWFPKMALASPSVLHAVSRWPSAAKWHSRTVSVDVARCLERTGFTGIRPITLSGLLRQEMSDCNWQVSVALARRLGAVINQEKVETDPMLQERGDLLRIASGAHFLARDGCWHRVRDLSSVLFGEDEAMLCEVAPAGAVLCDDYVGESFEFFRVARRSSGYSRQDDTLVAWVSEAQDEQRRRAVLRYLVRAPRGRSLAFRLRLGGSPEWMREVLTSLDSPLLRDLDGDEKTRIILELDPSRLVVVDPVYPPPNGGGDHPVLEQLYRWWTANRIGERKRYEKIVFPNGFMHQDLGKWQDPDGIDRLAWFTMFALACYQSFGRTQDGQHRRFIEHGMSAGWWPRLARPIDDEDWPWRDRLRQWTSPSPDEQQELSGQEFLQWKRTLVDLYAIARGLEDFVLLLQAFPRFVNEANSRPSLLEVLVPGTSKLAENWALRARRRSIAHWGSVQTG